MRNKRSQWPQRKNEWWSHSMALSTRYSKGREPVHVTVLGLGYVGCVTAVSLATGGHSVFGVDRDETKVEMIQKGVAPIREPGVSEALRHAVIGGTFHASHELDDELDKTDAIFVC